MNQKKCLREDGNNFSYPEPKAFIDSTKALYDLELDDASISVYLYECQAYGT